MTICKICQINETTGKHGVCSLTPACQRELSRIFRTTKPDAFKASQRKHRAKHPERKPAPRCSKCRARSMPKLLLVLNDKHTKGRFQCKCGHIWDSWAGWVPMAIWEAKQ